MHVIGFDAHSGIRVPDDSWYRWYGESFIYLRMPLFTFLAGLVYAWRPAEHGRYRTFISKKVRRLIVPYVIFVALIGVLQTVLPGANNPTVLSPIEWFVYSLSPYWFLLSTFWIFAVVALLDSYGLLSRWYVIGGLATVLVALNMLTRPGSETILQYGNALTLAPFFLAGVMFHRFSWRMMPRWLLVILACVTVVLFAYTQMGIAGLVPEVDSRNEPLGVLLGVLFPVVVLSLRIGSPAVAWVGGYSSGIFLLHPFTVAGVREILERLGVADPLVLFLLCTIAGISLAILGTYLLKKVRVGRVMLGERV